MAGVTPGTTEIASNVSVSAAATDNARALGVPVEYLGVVFDAIELFKEQMQEDLSSTDGEYVGLAVVQEVFEGSKCRDGLIKKGSNVRIMRGDKILQEIKVGTLWNLKAKVDTIESGDECGIGLLDF